MILQNRLIQRFREIVGWPYQSPGSNDENGIDCSGAFVRAFRLEGASIYHGSNRIIRAHCRDVRKIRSLADLEPGMAVFKGRENATGLSTVYKPGGKYYNPALPLDYYHIGLVVSTAPLEIIHATTPKAKMDTSIGQWLMAGYLLGVDYTKGGETIMSESKKAIVTAPTGNTVNFRQQPKSDAALVQRYPKLPVGTEVDVISSDGDWTMLTYKGVAGYIKSEFLRTAEQDLEARVVSLEGRVFTLEESIKKEVEYFG